MTYNFNSNVLNEATNKCSRLRIPYYNGLQLSSRTRKEMILLCSPFKKSLNAFSLVFQDNFVYEIVNKQIQIFIVLLRRIYIRL